jgi:hypothetical protein
MKEDDCLLKIKNRSQLSICDAGTESVLERQMALLVAISLITNQTEARSYACSYQLKPFLWDFANCPASEGTLANKRYELWAYGHTATALSVEKPLVCAKRPRLIPFREAHAFCFYAAQQELLCVTRG